MTSYIFPPAPQPSVAVRGTEQRYPVARIFCVGRNYAAHAREMGGDPGREPPFYFTKPASAITASGSTVAYPPGTKDYHYEMELVIAIGAPVFKVTPEVARVAVWGYAAGLDMTRRDLQAEAKKAGRPWDTAKGFDHSAPASELVPVADAGAVFTRRLWLEVNGELRQQSGLDEMVFTVADVIHELSKLYALKAGDLVFMGTPAGVAALQCGDQFRAGVDGLVELGGHIA